MQQWSEPWLKRSPSPSTSLWSRLITRGLPISAASSMSICVRSNSAWVSRSTTAATSSASSVDRDRRRRRWQVLKELYAATATERISRESVHMSLQQSALAAAARQPRRSKQMARTMAAGHQAGTHPWSRPQPAALSAEHRRTRSELRHRSGRYRQDLSGSGERRGGA